MEEPENPKHFLSLLDMLGSDDMLLFATDYPHWDFDSPDQAFPVRLPADLERKIMSENARAVYRLPPADRASASPAVTLSSAPTPT
jgi:predicted TIM-barrel fold metal-dependent hydrolase